jgi:hypothetical protein
VSVPVFEDWFFWRRWKLLEKDGVVGAWDRWGCTARGPDAMMLRDMGRGAARLGATHESATSLNWGKTSWGPWSGSRGRAPTGTDRVTTMGFAGLLYLRKRLQSPSRRGCSGNDRGSSLKDWVRVIELPAALSVEPKLFVVIQFVPLKAAVREAIIS